MTQAETDFLNEYVRTLLVKWGDYCLRNGHLPEGSDLPEGSLVTPLVLGKIRDLEMHPMYLEYAVEKGWLTKAKPYRLTAKGMSSAAAFLRR